MNGHLWRQFSMLAHDPIFFDGQPYVDLNLFSKEEFPALKLLKHNSTIEILVLAQLILCSENVWEELQWLTMDVILELFENYDCTNSDVKTAIANLLQEQKIITEVKNSGSFYAANVPQLIAEGIYTENKWKHLYKLGLYIKICKN